jgi:hypothetical protein
MGFRKTRSHQTQRGVFDVISYFHIVTIAIMTTALSSVGRADPIIDKILNDFGDQCVMDRENLLYEVDDKVVQCAALYCDYRPSLLAQACEVMSMIAAGSIDESHLRGEIGAVLSGTAPGRDDAGQITLYRSLGITAQDLAVAHHVLKAADEKGSGQVVTF